MSDLAAVKRQLKIKYGVVQRLSKETGLYRKEAEGLETKRAKLVLDGAEEWDIKNAGKMIEESGKMVLDTTSRLKKASDELEALITSAKKDFNLGQDEDLLKAEEILQSAKA
ncbi:unnamed protein product [Cyclocybe aegerita]|uniref:Tubulin-specific chaperone A n=1 Tax=Cyclocybe aegerita TaxID=1973307 RepID=A0A8S0WSV2_CYCAE|nr:unnamed protein product [Cyclocybe aegerita]